MNLIKDKWIPARRRSGVVTRITPWQITEEDDPFIDLCFPRPDFNGSVMQMLIGLLQTTMTPRDLGEWMDLFYEPPDSYQLKSNLEHIAHAFNLDGEKPRFMQAYEEFDDGHRKRIESILIDSPGDSTMKKNTDHFVKREQFLHMCLPCVAAALHTLQTNSPSGGAGVMTSIRGGGPITTIILGSTIWQTVWLNVLPADWFREVTGNVDLKNDKDIFPWLSPTRSSEISKEITETTPEHVHPLQNFWNLPRRIQLEIKETEPLRCDLCGELVQTSVKTFITRPKGVDYASGVWKHPLSPHYTKDSYQYCVHPSPGGIVYRHWVGLVQSREDNGGTPAMCVKHVREKIIVDLDEQNQFRVWAFGYDMKNMKARCWYESVMPLVKIRMNLITEYDERIQKLVIAAEQVSSYLRSSVKAAWFNKKATVSGDFSFVQLRFWHDTEQEFFSLLDSIKTIVENNENGEDIMKLWHVKLVSASMKIFDDLTISMPIENADPERVAKARNSLRRMLYGKKIRELLA